MIAVLFAILLSVSPIEQSYGPYARLTDSGPPAFASSPHSVLLAWSEIPAGETRARMHVTLLDFSGRAIAPIAILPHVDGFDAVKPFITNEGEGFRVHYLERLQNVVVDVDGNGTPGVPRAAQPVAKPEAGRAGWITAPILADCWMFRCRVVGTKYTLQWSYGGRSGGHDAGEAGGSPIASAEAGGKKAVFAWNDARNVNWITSDGIQHSVALFPAYHRAPGVACDANDCVIAVATASGDVQAVTFDIDEPLQPMIFTVNATETFDDHAQVTMMAAGRFLVSYSSGGETATTMAARVVTLGAPKKRSVR